MHQKIEFDKENNDQKVSDSWLRTDRQARPRDISEPPGLELQPRPSPAIQKIVGRTKQQQPQTPPIQEN